MSRIFDEKFEGTGYEETGWTEVVGAGSTIDEDQVTSVVSSPSGWGNQCLKIASTGNDAYTYNNVGAEAITYWRFEFIITAESVANDGYLIIAYSYQSSFGGTPWYLFLNKDSEGNRKFLVDSQHDGAAHYYFGFPTLALNTKYRFEIMWDATNDHWGWRIDGVNQPNDQDSTSPVTTNGNLTSTHQSDSGVLILGSFAGVAFTTYYDLVACDSADWVGAEASTFVPRVTMF